MRKTALLASILAVAAVSVALAAARGTAAPEPGLAHALKLTVQATSQRYALHVRIRKGNTPMTLRIHGQASARTVSLRVRLGDLRLADGTTVPGSDGAALLDGPFLYERAPGGLAVFGKVRWLRLSLAELSSSSSDLTAIRAMTPEPLLRVLGEAHMHAAGSHIYRGVVPYDSPIVRAALTRLTGGLEFRSLRLRAYVGHDGLLHRLVLTGRTADGKTTLSIAAHLFGFGKAVHVQPPKPGTFMDKHLAELGA
ncbi:MAG: hypothetical protein QOF43_835 [Gaiellaceae bacterium]|jgi:hypothetical protein|nr:hypothetical protein [Gaiellaceae bacterium]